MHARISSGSRKCGDAPLYILSDLRRDLPAFSGYDDRQRARARTVQDLIDHDRGDSCRGHPVEHCVDISEYRPAEQYHYKVYEERDHAHRHVGLFLLDRKGEEINPAGRRAAYIKERHPGSQKDAGTDRGHQPAARVHRYIGEYHIKKQRRDHHRLRTFYKKRPAYRFVADGYKRDVEQKSHRTHRQAEKIVQDQRQPGDAARRESGISRKGINAGSIKYTAGNVIEEIPYYDLQIEFVIEARDYFFAAHLICTPVFFDP